MVEEKKEIAVETVFVLPRNQFYWSYQINEGAIHTEPKEQIFEFLKEFVSARQYRFLIDLLSRMQPFLILVRDDRVIELSKKDIDISYLRKNIEDEITGVLNNYDFNNTNKTLNTKVKELQKRVLKY